MHTIIGLYKLTGSHKTIGLWCLCPLHLCLGLPTPPPPLLPACSTHFILQEARAKSIPTGSKTVAHYNAGQLDLPSNKSHTKKLKDTGQVLEIPFMAPPK
jgi:hypothetical protein